MDSQELPPEEDRKDTLESIIENVQLYAMFLLTLNQIDNEEDTLYVRDGLFESLTPEDDRVFEFKETNSKDN